MTIFAHIEKSVSMRFIGVELDDRFCRTCDIL
jgi:hypothetical protein